MGPSPCTVLSMLLLALAPLAAGDVFVDVTRERGLDFSLVNGATGKKYLVEAMPGGAAWLDFDGDGYQDLYLVQAHHHPETALEKPGGPEAPVDKLFRNLAGRRFEDVTAHAGVGDRGYGMGAAVGDYDGDGKPDLLVTNYGPNTLYHNRGDGTFEDATARAHVAGGGWSTSAAWGDLDGDGRLDLYVARYLDYDTRRHGACSATVPGSTQKVPAYCHPHRFEGTPDLVYRNVDGGTFEDLSRKCGVGRAGGWLESKGLGVVMTDFDQDGDLDVLVANDSVANHLWRNLGGFRFEDAALELGFALNADGAAQAGMGIDCGDVDGDGRLDIYVTNYSRETDTLYANAGGAFIDVTSERGLAKPTYLPLAFGTRLLDFDQDGDLDLYVANGHVLDNIEQVNPGEGITYGQPDLLLANDGAGRFRDVSGASGAWFARALVGRGVAEADYDNDGDPDLVLTHVQGPAVLLENRAGSAASWIGIDLRPGQAGALVLGSRIEVEAGGRKLVREVRTDGSYLCAHDPRVRVGLPPGTSSATVTVRWPGGGQRTHTGLATGKYHELKRN